MFAALLCGSNYSAEAPLAPGSRAQQKTCSLELGHPSFSFTSYLGTYLFNAPMLNQPDPAWGQCRVGHDTVLPARS